MNTLFDLWKKLTKKKYREAFVSSQLKRGIPFQIRTLRNQRGWSQADLAERAGITQGVISRTEDPDYGSLTFNTILRIAAGFDVAFIGRFVPFSELGKWFVDLSEESVRVPSFTEEKIVEVALARSDAAGSVWEYGQFYGRPLTVSSRILEEPVCCESAQPVSVPGSPPALGNIPTEELIDPTRGRAFLRDSSAALSATIN